MRRTLIGMAFSFGAMTASAQTPAPAPTPSPAPRVEKKRAPKPAPAPQISEEASLLFDKLPGLEGADLFDGPVLLKGTPGLEWDLIEPMIPMEPMIPFEAREPLEALMPMEPMEPMEPMIPLAPMTPHAPLDFYVPDVPHIPDAPHVPDVPDVPDVISCCVTAKPAIAQNPTDVWHVPGQSQFERQFGDLTSEPPQAWAQKDPADSLYRLARQTLNRGEYRRASQLFGDISQRFPNSAYAADARYWRAFALYRIGGTTDLKDALASLETQGNRYYQASLKTDAATLASRIRGALAQRGDPRMLTAVERAAGEQGVPCDKEDAAVRVQALSALGDMDKESTTPILRRILEKRDRCSASLRRNALFLDRKSTRLNSSHGY